MPRRSKPVTRPRGDASRYLQRERSKAAARARASGSGKVYVRAHDRDAPSGTATVLRDDWQQHVGRQLADYATAVQHAAALARAAQVRAALEAYARQQYTRG